MNQSPRSSSHHAPGTVRDSRLPVLKFAHRELECNNIQTIQKDETMRLPVPTGYSILVSSFWEHALSMSNAACLFDNDIFHRYLAVPHNVCKVLVIDVQKESTEGIEGSECTGNSC